MAPRKRWLRQPLSWRRGGLAALVVLALVAAGALILDADAGGEFAAIVELVRERGREPVELLVGFGQGSEILILSDVRGRAAPKRLAAEAIPRLAEGPGLDAVVLEVPASEQPYIDAFLAGGDPAGLLGRPAAVREQGGVPREFLRIYEAVRDANEGLPPSRRVRVVAADVEEWPPDGAAPRDIGRAYVGRAERILGHMDQQLFSVNPDARVLVFVDGYLALQGSFGELEYGGGEPVRVEWLGELLRRRSGSGARTVLVDPGTPMGGVQRLPGYRGTTLHRSLRREIETAAGVRVGGELAAARNVVPGLSAPGLMLRILPEGTPLRELAQGYIFLPVGR